MTKKTQVSPRPEKPNDYSGRNSDLRRRFPQMKRGHLSPWFVAGGLVATLFLCFGSLAIPIVGAALSASIPWIIIKSAQADEERWRRRLLHSHSSGDIHNHFHHEYHYPTYRRLTEGSEVIYSGSEVVHRTIRRWE